MRSFVKTFLVNESGATAIEYGLIAALIAVVVITAVTTVGTNLKGTFNNVANGVNYSSPNRLPAPEPGRTRLRPGTRL